MGCEKNFVASVFYRRHVCGHQITRNCLTYVLENATAISSDAPPLMRILVDAHVCDLLINHLRLRVAHRPTARKLDAQPRASTTNLQYPTLKRFSWLVDSKCHVIFRVLPTTNTDRVIATPQTFE